VTTKDRIEMNFLIAGKSVRLSLPPQRFEQTVDRIDAFIAKGKTLVELEALLPGKFERAKPPVLVPVKPPEKAVKPPVRIKVPEPLTPASMAAQFPTMNVPDLIKKISVACGISAAAARYHITKARKD
jgi:hypothetical protein